ncbi:PatA/PatG family cyanobactin maturation protease [Aquimarina sp. 2201CG5-10]|uniref:PatA/PatG family cyanobactin maturation protease n=1 Tax=Aquimarina callyspongiae TaxID=3098150 RepID=UPI002AB4C166|nr:PatA/PatG family cyanobactin maturation protease [Aquimarina sp. 2201CG5-10]MDY8136455.1 PatA/PatG family cyanobactin maturation protease [Aquimarina sp. 2201CG5-10]
METPDNNNYSQKYLKEYNRYELLLPGLTDLWKLTKGDVSINIAVIDSAVNYDHECLKNSSLFSLNISENTNSNIVSHGTSVASIIFGQHNTPIKGIAPNCKGFGITLYNSENDKLKPASQIELARSIHIALENKADIINISGGEFTTSGASDTLLSKALETCQKKGVLIVAAAGNDGCECLHLPAADPSVLAVGAMDENQEPSSFSNWGKAYKRNGILFPGNNILTATTNNQYVTKSGTSFATPIASGVVALLLSISKQYGIHNTPYDIFQLLLKTVIKCDDTIKENCDKNLVGTISISKALDEIISQKKQIDNNKKSIGVSIQENSHYTHFINSNQNQKIMTETDQTLTTSEINISESVTSPLSNQEMMNEITPNEISLSESTPETELQTDLGDTEGIEPSSSCGCNKGEKKKVASLVYSIGALGYEFQTVAKKDAFQQAMGGQDPNNPEQFLKYLDNAPEAVEDVLWTINLDATQVYVIYPVGGYANIVHDRLKEFLKDQISGKIQRISVPGVIGGQITLMNGLNVPVLVPKGQGMYSWSNDALISAVLGKKPTGKNEQEQHDKQSAGIHNFLDRVYYELRNLGISAQERAINYAATNAFQLAQVFERAVKDEMELSDIDVERSPICAPNSDCWDVKLTFFNPTKRTEQARKIYRFTVDVSYAIPVTIGEVRSWSIF